MRRIAMFSGGVASWAAAKKDAKLAGVEGLTLLFADTKTEHEDTYRFLEDAAVNIGAPLVKIADGRDIWQVFRDDKRRMCDRWLEANCDRASTVVLIGYHVEEIHRFRQTRDRYATNGWRCEAPLCDKPYLSSREIHDWAEREGLREQFLYQAGMPHANCGGMCVKMGQSQARLALKVIPATYARWEREEQGIREYLGKDVAILRDRRGGDTRPMTLREFRERVESGGKCELFDAGGCGCFAGEDDTP